MTFPFDIQFGFIYIPIHLLFEFLAFIIAYKYYQHLRKREGDEMDDDKRFSIIVGAAAGALIGARLLGTLEHLDLFFNPPSILYYYSSKTIVGAIIGGIIGVEITKKIITYTKPTGDLFTLPLILGIIIGRIGCFLTGVSDSTVGIASNMPWAFDQGDGIARHPTALYEIVFLGILFFILHYWSKHKNFPNGSLFKIGIASYLLFRFFIEFIKPVEKIFLGLSVIQIASLIFALYYIYVLSKSNIFTKK